MRRMERQVKERLIEVTRMKRSWSRSPDGDVEVEGGAHTIVNTALFRRFLLPILLLARCHPPAAKSSPLPSPTPTEPCSLNFVPTPISANVPVYSILDTTFIKGSVNSQVNTFVVYANPLYYQLSSLPPANWTFVC
ncbi:hypothetical protein VKT23_001395 [Stygiomarasmius scandens]|uniref:Uncharacterized protein n=1 Tax=Marasmiellus scandens TaxID=2682957 RepID=A0ABR1K1G6_9AGAR